MRDPNKRDDSARAYIAAEHQELEKLPVDLYKSNRDKVRPTSQAAERIQVDSNEGDSEVNKATGSPRRVTNVLFARTNILSAMTSRPLSKLAAA